MHDCDYCEESFSSEDAYLDHLATTHEGELGRIDQRRVENHRGITSDSGDDDGGQTLLLAGFVVAVSIAVIVIIGFVLLDDGVGGGGDVHEHGPITLEVDGDELDFEQTQYMAPDRFHFHRNDGNVWHMHPTRLTLEQAMDELGIPITETSVTLDGETYDDADPDTSVEILVNGDPADLDHELEGTGVPEAINGEGDHIQITIETPEGDGLPPEQTYTGSSTTAGS